MKRLIALILALLLALGATSALAADYPIEEKFYRQMLESAYKATLTFSAEGNATAAIPQGTWAIIRSLAPRLTLEGDHSLMRGEGQISLRLLIDGAVAGESKYLYNDDLMGLGSDLLAGKDVYYTAAQGWEIASLFASMQESAWPALWPALLAVQPGTEEEAARLNAAILPYETKLGVWMNGYAAFSTGVENNKPYTQLLCQIPVQALKAEIKQLLIDFYNDAALLSLLKEYFPAEQAAAYLQPAARDALFTLLDQLQLKGNIEIIRRYDAQGKAMLDRVSLPFAENQPFSQMVISVLPDELGQRWEFAGSMQDGTDFDISCVIGEDTAYSGSVYLLLPEKEDSSFVVTDEAAAREVIDFDYNLNWDAGEETYSVSTKRCQRIIEGMLVIKPREGSHLPAQSISLNAEFSSGSSQRSATQLNAALLWRDLDGDASISLKLASKTAAPFAVSSLNNAPSAMRIDLMEQQSYESLLAYWGQQSSSWLQSMLLRLFPSLFLSSPSAQ